MQAIKDHPSGPGVLVVFNKTLYVQLQPGLTIADYVKENPELIDGDGNPHRQFSYPLTEPDSKLQVSCHWMNQSILRVITVVANRRISTPVYYREGCGAPYAVGPAHKIVEIDQFLKTDPTEQQLMDYGLTVHWKTPLTKLDEAAARLVFRDIREL